MHAQATANNNRPTTMRMPHAGLTSEPWPKGRSHNAPRLNASGWRRGWESILRAAMTGTASRNCARKPDHQTHDKSTNGGQDAWPCNARGRPAVAKGHSSQ